MILNFKTICNNSYKFICICFCLYQLQSVAISYFTFSTVTQNKFKSSSIVRFPSLHVCFLAIIDAMNRDYIRKKYYVDTLMDPYVKSNSLLINITAKEIFENTLDTISHTCIHRDKSGNEMIDSDNCGDYLFTKKYLSQQYICYQIKAKNIINYNLNLIESAIRYEKVMYIIGFKRPLSDFRKIRFILTETGLPHRGKMYSPVLYKETKERMSLTSCQ